MVAKRGYSWLGNLVKGFSDKISQRATALRHQTAAKRYYGSYEYSPVSYGL